MRFSWPENTKFTRLNLEVEDRSCPICERRMSICDHRRHSIFTLQGPTQLICKLAHCPDSRCASRPTTFRPLAEEDLLAFRNASVPDCQQKAIQRRKIMRKARSKKQRPFLRKDLERRYRESGG